MRVVIADDESLARSNLRSILQEVQVPLRIIGEATNGEELVELVKQLTPDIAFVDIRMPKVNGLEAIRAGKSISPNTKWFILTGFSEFDYAKEAMRLGASDYLLKPVDPSELDHLLRKAYADYNTHRFGLNKQFERDIVALYHGVSSLSQEESDSYLLRADFIGVVFYIDSHLPEKQKAERQIGLVKRIRDMIHESVTETLRVALFGLPNGELAVVVAWLKQTGQAGKWLAESFLRHVDETIDEVEDADFKVTLCQADQCGAYETLHARLNRLQELAELRTIAGIGRKWTLRELEPYSREVRFATLAKLLIGLYEAYREASYLDFMRMLPALGQALTSLGSQDTVRDQIADYLNCAFCCQVHVDQPAKVWIQQVELRGEQLLAQARNAQRPDLVSQVVSFIDTHYQLDIGVGQIAEQLKITPNYLSAVFHKKTGVNFVRYLTNIRMLKAKELLADPGLQIQQVSERVGYYNTRYFTKLFTEFAGCTPSEYRKTQLACSGFRAG